MILFKQTLKDYLARHFFILLLFFKTSAWRSVCFFSTSHQLQATRKSPTVFVVL